MTGLAELGDVRVQSVLDADPDLGREIPEEDWAAARQATSANTMALGVGQGDVLTRLAERPEISGFLILEGLLLREASVHDRALPELLGPGDLLDPPVLLDSFLPVRLELTALAPSRVAVLGAGFARACGRWPSLLGAIERRKATERQRVAIHGAIAQLPRVDVRIVALLWHLASVWGRMTPQGVVVPFALTHEMVGRFIGAQRPTVSLALKQLADDGLVDRTAEGTWLLCPGSDDYLHGLLGGRSERPSVLGRARGRAARSPDAQRALRADAARPLLPGEAAQHEVG